MSNGLCVIIEFLKVGTNLGIILIGFLFTRCAMFISVYFYLFLAVRLSMSIVKVNLNYLMHRQPQQSDV